MHLIGYLDELSDASWKELESYQRLTGIDIPPSECRIIIILGREQESMAYKARKKDCAAPFVSDESSAYVVSSFLRRFKTK